MQQHCVNKEYIIIGAGPGGYQVGHELKQLGLDYLILEKGTSVGEFFKRYPRHGTLISINRKYTGEQNEQVRLRYDWNSLLSTKIKFPEVDPKYFPCSMNLLKYFELVQEEEKLNIQFNVELENITKDPNTGEFVLTAKDHQEFKCKYLILATGWNKEKIPSFAQGVPGVQTYGTHDLDKERYKDKKVAILGAGNSAFETADHIIDVAGTIHILSPNAVTLSWHSRYVGSLRAVNNNFLDTYLLKAGNIMFVAKVMEVKAVDGRFEVWGSATHTATQKGFCASYDEVITCCGFVFDDSILDQSLKPNRCPKGKFPLMKGTWEHETVPNLYFAGTLTHILDFKSAASGFIHGFRYNSVILARYLANKNSKIPLPHVKISSVEEVAEHIIKNINVDSGLFLQQDFLCYVIVPQEDGSFLFYDWLTIPLANEGPFKDCPHYYTLTLAFGEQRSNEIDSLLRIDQQERAYFTPNSHPILRRFNKGSLVGQWHIEESVDGHYFLFNGKPIVEYLKASLKVAPEMLERRMDEAEVIVDIPIDACWAHFVRETKMKTLPYKAKLLLVDNHNPLDSAIQFSGKMKGDVKDLDWDLRITKICRVNRVHIIDIWPFGQLETFCQIRQTIKFMANCPKSTKICWKTEWLSDLQQSIVQELLQTKKEMISNWPKPEIDSYVDQISSTIKTPSEEVRMLKIMLQQAKPDISFFDSEHLKIYVHCVKKAEMAEQTLRENVVIAEAQGYFGGASLTILDDFIQKEKNNMDNLKDLILSVL